ncbi:InlB B-repeat-containing protein [Leucobacter aridicollis]|uniref:InlB B-repeat-containing protein n=1 Tax=Leucobacter aridicollis TaxID=283878 RepID=UPI002105ECF4|nr:InlB B-repeat-containing protein [Leucobacter aridicollis]UTX51911.1 InlB B-repeat-containing protein [Leucobacter aridicollis]
MVFGSLLLTAPAHAAESVSVDTADELRDAFNDASVDTAIELSAAFPDELPGTLSLTNSAGIAIEIDGTNHSLSAPAVGRHIQLTVGGAGSVALRNLELAPRADGTNGGLQVTQNDSAAVELSGITVADLGASAVVLGGSGSGQLLLEDMTIARNSASTGAALSFGRNNADAQTTMNRISVLENVGTNGAGYSGGAMSFRADSRGAVLIQNSLFRDNEFREGGAQPRGGAISLHNSYVQLTLHNDLFEGNSTASSSTPANADGGAVSVMNPNQTHNGSLTVTNSSFIGNTAQDDGAAIFVEGQNASSTPPFLTKLTVKNSTFANNVSGGETADTGGAIQVSLRVEVDISNNTFFGNTKDQGRGGVDFGVHTTFNSGGFQRPAGALADNVFTRSNSVAGMLGTSLTCSGGVACSVPAGEEEAYAKGIFGTVTPEPAANGTTVIAGDARSGAESRAIPTLAIVPPVTDATPTASRIVTGDTGLDADERGVAYRPTGPQDAGAYTMDYVRFDAAENGGSWTGLTPALPGEQGSFISDATASNGWFEVASPGASVPLPATNPTPPAGKSFIGWFESPTGGTQVTAPVAVAGQTVYAQFADVEYTVTFEPGNGEASFSETVAHGDTVAEPAEPVREGFTFAGWTLDGDEYDFAAAVTSDLTLIAVWEEVPVVEHTVTFDPQNGEASFTEAVTDGEAVTKPADPTREGFTFTGWTLAGAAYDFDSPVTADITLVAGWEEVAVVTHTVTFDPQNGSDPTEIQVADGDPVAQPADPTREGFTFIGWTLQDVDYDFDSPVTSDITLVAQWEEIPVVTHTVTFDPDNGEATSTESVVDGGSVAKPADPVKDGFAFTGWTLDGEPYEFSKAVTADITLVAAWEEVPAVTHVVTFDPDNGDEVSTVTVVDGELVAQPSDPVREGHTFAGWTLNGEPYDFATPVTADTTLLASWEPVGAKNHTVTFDPDNGQASTTVTVADGKAVAKPADPVRDGYTFTGWTLNGAVYDFSSPVTTDLTLVAAWKTAVVPPTVDPNKPTPPVIETTGGAPLAPVALAAVLLLGLGVIAVVRARRSWVRGQE